MDFLSPTSIGIASALTVPPLVALYFLKLKRTVKLVPSTLLWKRAIEDLHVNSPFQRLRSSLLLLLQLLVLILGAIALGKPMFQIAQRQEDTVILLVDQSASMAVLEDGGKSRLDKAKEAAKSSIDNMGDDASAMVIAFCDRAFVVAPFNSNRESLKRQIDNIEQTQSTSQLGEAMSLAEAHAQNIIIGSEEAGADIPPERLAPPASVFLFTDGRIEDADKVALQKFDLSNIQVVNVAKRADNVGILAMDARRNYETPELLEVSATIQNFGPKPISIDAVLYVDGRNVDVQTIELGPAPTTESSDGVEGGAESAIKSSTGVAAFDDIEFGGGGLVEVVLRTDDALSADDRAWTIIDEPSHVSVLLVTDENPPLESVLDALPLKLTVMTPETYTEADDVELSNGRRSAFDVVIMDRFSTDRLFLGNYFFWGAAPQLEGVSAGKSVSDQVVFNWDETHPILRHVAVETLHVFEWATLKVPDDATVIVEGESSPVLAFLTREGSQYLISAFSLIAEDESGQRFLNTYWATSVDFIVFVQNAINYLAANISTSSRRAVVPGEPVTWPIPERTKAVTISRPDGKEDSVLSAGYQSIQYARTRQVGPYEVSPHVPGAKVFAVNLFNEMESNIKPSQSLTFGSERIQASTAKLDVNQPAWKYFLLALLVFLIFEWVVYNRRVFV